ncbi:Glycine-rich domain-containing protein 1, partial [Bienertia sinuspersici]
MKKEQAREWAKAQSLRLSVDLVSAAKSQLKFLATVDRNRYLYEGPTLERAIYRVLGNHNIISSIHGTSKSESVEIWNKMYPEEPYELDYNKPSAGDVSLKNLQSETFTNYDLVSAVKRQAPFYYQVSRPHVSDDVFLKDAMARYKGFLYLIWTNKRKNMKHFFVPTYDVDLMWHSHQLNPIPYNDDSSKLFGKVLEHDDTDSDRTKGKKLDTGFTGTSKLWEDTFGLSYWKAGTMNRGNAPTPVTQTPFPYTYEGGKKFHALEKGDKGELRVTFSKKQTDKLFNAKRTLTISSESEEKQVSYFQCEPNGEFLFELVCHSPSDIQLPNSLKPLGSCSLSLQECLNVGSRLFVDKWIPVVPAPGILTSKPILLHVSLSFTPPTLAPQVFHLMQSQPILNNASIFPLSSKGKVKHAKGQTNDVLSLQMRDLRNDITRSNPELLKEVLYVTNSGETHTLAEFKRNEWYIKGANCSSKLHKTSGNDGHLFELVGDRMVRLFAGRKLDYEPTKYQDKRSERDFMTAIEFSTEYPYGRAVAIIDLKHGILKVKEKWMTLAGITLAFIVQSDILKREGDFAVKVNHEGCLPNYGSNGDACGDDCSDMEAGLCYGCFNEGGPVALRGGDGYDNDYSFMMANCGGVDCFNEGGGFGGLKGGDG